MPMKVGLVQAAAGTGTPTFTQDFTDSGAGFSSDVKAAIFIGSNATANHTSAAHMAIAVGFAAATGGNTQASSGSASGDNIGADSDGTFLATSCYMHPVYSNNVSDGECSITDTGAQWLSNGIRVAWTDQSNSELITVLLLGGDIEARVVQITLSGTGEVTGAHGLSGAPEVIFLAKSTGTAVAVYTIGAWATGGTYGTGFVRRQSSGAAADISGHILSTAIGGEMGATNNSATVTYTVTTADGTNIGITPSASSTDALYMLALRGTSTPITAKAGVFDTPTSPGDGTAVSGMSAAPQVLFTIPSRQTATGNDNTDAGGAYGLIVSVKQGASTLYGGVTLTSDDGANPTVEKSQSTNSQALRVLDVAAVADVEATVKASTGWASDGVVLDFSNVNASAFKIPYLAFGLADTALYVKLLTHSSAASATSIEGVVLNATRDTVIGEFAGQAFEAALEGGQAVLKIACTDISPNGGTLTTSDTPLISAYNTTLGTVGMVSTTVIEE